MSRPTPRKSRHRQNASGGGGAGSHGHGPRTVAASDYESDATHYMETRGGPSGPQIPHRTNTELNLSVLQRYMPSIRSIASIAANAVVYTFDLAVSGWDKSGVEGTMFVCEQEPVVIASGRATLPRSCVFVLNRRGLENVAIDLASVNHCEVTSELLIFSLDEAAAAGAGAAATASDGSDPKVIGLWIHADQEDTRETNATIIQEHWRQVRAACEAVATSVAKHPSVTSLGAAVTDKESVGPAIQAIGRKLSLSDLFGRSKECNEGNPT